MKQSFNLSTDYLICNDGLGGGDRILADLSKTFECVNANTFFKEHLESKAQLLNGLNSRVADSKTKEFILVTISNFNHLVWKKLIKIGALQGAILDPILFIMYIDDIQKAFPVTNKKLTQR